MTPFATNLLDDLRALEKCFSEDEIAKLRAALALVPVCDSRAKEELTNTFSQGMRSLPLVAEAIQASPKISAYQRVGERKRDADTLVDRLCLADGRAIEFSMPTSAVLARAFLLAKVNFVKALEYSLESAGEDALPAIDILNELVVELIFSKLTADLLTAFLSNALNPMDLRRLAARKLIDMWSDGVRLPVSKLPSVLLSAWRARVKVRAIYGTLIGVNEVFSLMQAQCESRFLNYFVRDRVTEDEREAFREFLFAISYEDLEKVQEYMETHGLKVISPKEVQEIVATPLHPVLVDVPSAEQIFTSYERRRIRADYRAIAGSAGPRKTAEGYILQSLLDEELQLARRGETPPAGAAHGDASA